MRYVILLLLATITSCSYNLKPKANYSHYDLTLNLNPDSTFMYLCHGCMAWDTIKGKWRLEGNKVVLNSYFTNNDTKSFSESNQCDTCGEGINIKVIDFESKVDMQYASISAFKQKRIISEVTTNENGTAIIKRKDVDSIKVDYVGYNSLTFKPVNFNTKLYVINLKPEQLNRFVITNEKYKIKKNRIVSPEGFILKQSNNINE